MPVRVDVTPNPNAMKFTVGQDVGGPQTFVAGQEDDHPLAESLLALGGVTSIFMTSDFVTITKSPEAQWDAIAPAAIDILEEHFGG